MGIFSRLFRHKAGYYAAAAAAALAVAALMLWKNGFYGPLAYMDALTVAGAVVGFLGLLGLASHFGAFDTFGYSFSTFGNRRYENLYEYSRAKQESRSRGGWTFMPFITVGAVFLLAGFLVGMFR